MTRPHFLLSESLADSWFYSPHQGWISYCGSWISSSSLISTAHLPAQSQPQRFSQAMSQHLRSSSTRLRRPACSESFFSWRRICHPLGEYILFPRRFGKIGCSLIFFHSSIACFCESTKESSFLGDTTSSAYPDVASKKMTVTGKNLKWHPILTSPHPHLSLG